MLTSFFHFLTFHGEADLAQLLFFSRLDPPPAFKLDVALSYCLTDGLGSLSLELVGITLLIDAVE